MSNRTADTVLDTFANVYRLCRLNRGNLHFRKQIFRFRGGSVYIADTGALVIMRNDVTTLGVAFYANQLLGNAGRFGPGSDSRKFWIDRARDCDPVPLP